MWKFHDFSVTQILREIIVGESRSSKTGVLCSFRGSEFCYFGKFQPSKSAKIHKNQYSEPLSLLKKMAHFALLQSSKMISRKI